MQVISAHMYPMTTLHIIMLKGRRGALGWLHVWLVMWRSWVWAPSKAPVVLLSKKLYPYCLVLVGYRIGIRAWFHNQTKINWGPCRRLLNIVKTKNVVQKSLRTLFSADFTLFITTVLSNNKKHANLIFHLKWFIKHEMKLLTFFHSMKSEILCCNKL